MPLGESGQTAPTNSLRPENLLDQNTADAQADAASPADTQAGFLRLGLLLVGTLALLLLPAVFRVTRRTLRRRDIRSGRTGAVGAWREVTDTAIDHGLFVRETETPRELAARLRALIGSERGTVSGEEGSGAGGGTVAEALDRLLVRAERSRYGRPGGDAQNSQAALLLADLDLVLRGIHSGSGRRVRMRATLLPASLWRSGERRIGRPAANA